MAGEEGTKKLQIQDFEEKQYPTTIESPINLYNMEYCYFNLPPSPPFSDLVLSPLWNSSDCNYAGGSISAIRRITDDLRSSNDSESYPDGSPGDFGKSLEMSPRCIYVFTIKERICQALRYIDSKGEDILIQFWAPMKVNSRCVLATSGQPFVVGDSTNGIHRYRMISLMYLFSVDGMDDGCTGLPGRVFKTKFPEWTPNVQYYSSKEFPQLDHALHYNIRGALALPVFEGESCVGVLELVMTSQKINYAPEFDKVCKALEATNLKSTGRFDQQDTWTCNEDFKNTQVEILELLCAVCESHQLPLAQTWLPSRHQNAVIYGNRFTGLTCVPFAFYTTDARMRDFREACLEHHLQDEQGPPGRAFSSLNACFCADISLFRKSDYPLVHYARMFGLQSSLTIPVCSNHSEKDTYVLEFFLPHSNTDHKIQLQIAASILATTKEILQNSKVIQWIEPKVGHFEIIELSVGEKLRFSPVPELKSQTMDTRHGLETSQSGLVSKEQDFSMQQRSECDVALIKAKSDANAENITFSIFEKGGKMTLQVLKQLLGKNLNAAANCLGVSRSTFKRLCRQHGISRWPRMKKTSNTNRFHQIREHVNEAAEQLVEKTSTRASLALDPMPGFGSNSSTNLNKPIHHGLQLQQIEATTFADGMREMQTDKSNTSVTFSSFGVLIGADKRVPESRIPPVATLQNGETAIVKARYGEYFIKFQLPFSSQLAELENKVADRLKLKIGTFRIQYQDADDDWILVACNDDLESCLSERRSLGDKSIKMLVETIDM